MENKTPNKMITTGKIAAGFMTGTLIGASLVYFCAKKGR